MAPLPSIKADDTSLWYEIKAQLTEKEWQWVKYFIIADLTVKEIMEIENITANAVKGWGQSVRRKLRNDKTKQLLIDFIEQ